MNNNPFKEIENEGVRSFYAEERDQRVRSGINSTLGTVRFLGKIADVYLNRLVDTMVCLTGGGVRDDRSNPEAPADGKRPPNLPPEEGPQGPLDHS